MKVKEEIDLTLLDFMELEENEHIGSATRLNPFCFSLTTSSLVKAYFCAETEEDLLTWTDGSAFPAEPSVFVFSYSAGHRSYAENQGSSEG